MILTYFNVGYYENNIRVFNKKKKFNLIINKFNDFFNNVNPIFCFNCLYLIQSNPILNSQFSNYILIDKKTKKFYEVLRHSLKNDFMRMNYCNNNCTNSIYNNYNSFNNLQCYDQQSYEQQCYDQQCYDQQCYDQQCYDQQSYDQQSYNQQCYDQQNYDQQCNYQQCNDQQNYDQQCNDQEFNDEESYEQEFNDEQSNDQEFNDEQFNDQECNEEQNYDQRCYNFEEESNCSKTISEITLDKTEEINDEKSYDLVYNDISKEVSIEKEVSKNEVSENNDFKDNISENEVLKNSNLKDDLHKYKNYKDELHEKVVFEDPIFEIEKTNKNLNEIKNCKKEVKKLSKKEKNKLKNERRKHKKKEEEEKKRKIEEEEKKLFENSYELNRLDMIDKLNKVNIENYEIIKNLSYQELKKKMEFPIIYDIKRKFYKLYGKMKNDINLNMNIYKDFKDFDLSKQYIVDRVKTYLNKSEFNRFYFNCIYEYIYFNNLNIIIKDKEDKIYDWQFYNKKYENNLKFYEQIFENEINEYLRDYIIEIIIKPFIKKKKDELKDKYNQYEKKLLKRNKVSYEESLLIIYNKMIEIDGKFYFGRKGWLIFDEDNNVKKVYY